jgi:formylglycine-generating enzyme required for sulfatase activity
MGTAQCRTTQQIVNCAISASKFDRKDTPKSPNLACNIINSVNLARDFNLNFVDGIMSKISSPISYVLLATTLLLLSGMSLSLYIDSAHASDCLAAPNASAPMGQHWYYRSVRQKGRKCWYLHETSAVRHRAAPRHSSHAAAAPATNQTALQSAPASPASAVREPEMIMLRGGTFMMGSDDDATEKPVHQVTLKPFAISRYPISVREWNECAAAKACGFVANGKDDAPVTNVSWSDAKQFVTWLAGTTHTPYRLPSEAEWEYAARGGTQTTYWWGNRFEPGLANCKGCADVAIAEQPVKVGSFKPNPFGLYDMGGGVDQWVEDCWHRNYHGAPSDGSPWIERNCLSHVIRSGSWQNGSRYVRPSHRDNYDTIVRYPTHGFRVAQAAVPATTTVPLTAAELTPPARATAPFAGAEVTPSATAIPPFAGPQVTAPATATAALAAPELATAPITATPPRSAFEAVASAQPVAPEATASATTTASTAGSHVEMLPLSTVGASPVGAPTQDPVQQSPLVVGDLKSTGGTGVVSAQTESNAEDVISVDKNADLNAENGGSDAQRYEPDKVRTLLFLLAIGLCVTAILVLVAARFRCLDCPHARAAAARAPRRRARWLKAAWLAGRLAWRRGAGAPAR